MGGSSSPAPPPLRPPTRPPTNEDHPALGSPLGIDGVHATSFALGALVAFTLGAVAYFVRRSRGTKITDSSTYTYGATTVK
jgi:hypothetical protein